MAEVAAQTQSAGQASRPHVGGYRPDIDGLRGVAVLLVVLWHAKLPGLPGGYAGVDIFFVISGFVITGSLLRDASGAGISIFRFYERRLRRIAPAFLVMLAAVLAAGLAIQLPAELTHTASVALGALAVAANLVLWRQGGYFGHGADTEPLRHVWSLSIEEQFYLVYPALLALLLARAPRVAQLVLAALGAISLALFLLLSRASPGAAFELGPARAWELIIGCVAALQARSWRASLAVEQALTLVGAAFMAGAAMTPLGSHATTVAMATGGAGLVVLFGQGRPAVSRVLASPPLLAVGLASYSLYLWHWPLLALARSLRPAGITVAETALLLAVTAVLGFASWRFVEQPLRRPWDGPHARRRFFGICGALLAFSAGASAVALAGGGLPGRFPPRVAALAAYEDFNHTQAWRTQFHAACFAERYPASEYDTAACLTAAHDRRNVLLWGDSHAAQLAGPLAELATRRGAHLMQATMPSCVPGAGAAPRSAACARFNQLVRERLETQRPDVVILSLSAAQSASGFVDEVDALTRRGASVIVVGPTPQFRVILAPALARSWPETPDASGWALPQPFRLDAVLKAAIRGRPGVRYISATDLFCPRGRCAIYTQSGAPLVWDSHHLTPEAAELLVGQVAAPLAEALRKPSAAPVQPRPAGDGGHAAGPEPEAPR